MARPLESQHVVVTGSSSGIGRAIALAAARDGAHILVHGFRNRRGAEQTAEQVRQCGGRSHVVLADLGDPSDRERLLRAAREWSDDRIDAWVHNAGEDVLTGDAAGESFEDKLDRLWRVDVRGTILLARAVAEHMLAVPREAESPSPSMVFMGWDQALEGMEGDAGQMFGPIKGAVLCFALSLAQSLAPAVRINSVAPGWIRTQWGAATDDYWNARATRSALAQRWGTSEDVAAAVMFLIAPTSSFVNGQIIRVNGGWNRRYDGAIE